MKNENISLKELIHICERDGWTDTINKLSTIHNNNCKDLDTLQKKRVLNGDELRSLQFLNSKCAVQRETIIKLKNEHNKRKLIS